MRVTIFLKVFISSCIALLLVQKAPGQAAQKTTKKHQEQYQCTPCGNDCDKEKYDEAGKCRHCQMTLVKSSTVTFKNIKPADICNYIKQHPDVVLLDVRTKDEFDGKANPNFGTIKNAVNIPVQELPARIEEIYSMKNKEILVYCSHSHRSPQASYILTQNGFNRVTNMLGGMSVMTDKSCIK
jgi:rhodanese-related sulfurtransferase/DNA-directed RNA polymerase subunit RPC12/RpoP